VTDCAIHISDLHRGKRESSDADDALVSLCHELSPVLVLVTGDLSNRGRPAELARARALLDRLPAPTLAVPGNHDIPYAFPARFTRPWRAFEEQIGTREPRFASERLVACGLTSVRPWRHQGGRLSAASLARAADTLSEAAPGALRVVALHHHLAGAPWRASRKFPLSHRDAALAALAAAGAELVVGGHIHQSSVVERHEFEVVEAAPHPSLVLATAPGFGRPRPRRTGEAQGLHVYRWDIGELAVETRVWGGRGFSPTAQRVVPRS
jgi:3',5'-cyclic AMP phosphodiesterase CpdA